MENSCPNMNRIFSRGDIQILLLLMELKIFNFNFLYYRLPQSELKCLSFHELGG